MWVIATLAGLAALITLVLCVPVDAVLKLEVSGRPTLRLRLRWFFGLVTREITKGEKRPEEKRGKAEDKRQPRRRWGSARGAFEILRTKGLLRQLKVLVKDVLHCLRIRDFTMDFRVGLDDPADTGLLFAVIGPANLFLGSTFSRHIKLQPSFESETILEGYCYGVVRLRPIQLSVPLLRFIFSMAAIRTVKALVLGKWKRGK